ncbi:chaperonin GroEL [Sesbania bispinosa]|nr:chaperonin GroEL [Sesbania bispinosa]
MPSPTRTGWLEDVGTRRLQQCMVATGRRKRYCYLLETSSDQAEESRMAYRSSGCKVVVMGWDSVVEQKQKNDKAESSDGATGSERLR